MSGTAQSTVLHGGQEGQISLIEDGGTYTVIDGQGDAVFEGDEIGAEFAYWKTTFGVPVDDVEVAS